jgi:hypothetical protein
LTHANVVSQRAIGVAQEVNVVVEPGNRVPGTTPGIGVDREARGERERSVFEPLGTQQVVAKRLLGA